MKILRYTDDVQKQVKSKTKPEPWLHIGLDGNTYAIWIWDTREVIEEAHTKDGSMLDDVKGHRANDNHEPLHAAGSSWSLSNDERYPVAYGYNMLWEERKQNERKREERRENRKHANEPFEIESLDHFKEVLNNGDYKIPGVRKAINEFLRAMDEKYGKHNNNYRGWYEAAKQGHQIY